jgi:hypothetical protein
VLRAPLLYQGACNLARSHPLRLWYVHHRCTIGNETHNDLAGSLILETVKSGLGKDTWRPLTHGKDPWAIHGTQLGAGPLRWVPTRTREKREFLDTLGKSSSREFVYL